MQRSTWLAALFVTIGLTCATAACGRQDVVAPLTHAGHQLHDGGTTPPTDNGAGFGSGSRTDTAPADNGAGFGSGSRATPTLSPTATENGMGFGSGNRRPNTTAAAHSVSAGARNGAGVGAGS